MADRLSPLIAILEAGNSPTKDDLVHAERLQALDIARLGQAFADEASQADEDMLTAIEDLI